MTEQARLRDARRSYQFWVDDAIIDHFGFQIGPYGLAVYLALARRAKQGSAFPSFKRLAADTGMSKRSVIRAIQSLQDCGLLDKTTRTDEDGDPTSNLYTLLPLTDYHPPSDAPQSPGSDSQTLPGDTQTPGVVTHSHYGSDSQSPKGSSCKDSHLEGSPPSVSPPLGEHTPGESEVELPGGRRTRKISCPGGLAEQAALAAELLTPSLMAWANDHVPTVDPHHECARFIAHSVAHGKRYGDLRAAFQTWLLHPLTRPHHERAQSTLEVRLQEAHAAARRFVAEDDDGRIRQSVIFDDPGNGLGNVLRSVERPAPAGLLVGAQRRLHAGGI